MSEARQPKGIPAGGQFAATAHAEPEGASLVGVRIGEPREMTREELVITGQAVDGSPSLSEVTRQVHHSRRQLAEAVKAMDQTMLNATIVHVRQVLPGAKELRLRATRIGDQQMIPTFVQTADDGFLGARYAAGPDGDWARRTVEGADPASVTEALAGITPHSEIWDTDTRCDYDPQTEEHIIYLDGRRRQEH
ncbi:hypothetical protein Achl_4205 (plasmid) [Pseudarthrobacter chlorophenolicus A6]|uniref:Uncharacterized protein n=1 Tax=Pseudarthrobacter chlorophenolicus (strain ATCC 700700 / DSM 12829 / CIP 107037 / JCM 12360 / KCTC 9906 / NCIMB 13794 / A6) TaxID=452863 RepID=B8HIA9_PSECP|nr:hypothetical protein [Pseudarthrobacter chlorophenolicus]ACL42156.1 hypothetical protein Achl_4205 [Pseudarthrobacter chlorophenolicus A6]SDQ14173.1 hypothetical protein SAMN04489738_0263 [Pseudarthrobacter chlorophenolicus]